MRQSQQGRFSISLAVLSALIIAFAGMLFPGGSLPAQAADGATLQISAFKHDNTGSALPDSADLLSGVTFTLTSADPSTDRQATTGADGRAIFSDLAEGDYTLTVKEVPASVVNLSKPRQISISKNPKGQFVILMDGKNENAGVGPAPGSTVPGKTPFKIYFPVTPDIAKVSSVADQAEIERCDGDKLADPVTFTMSAPLSIYANWKFAFLPSTDLSTSYIHFSIQDMVSPRLEVIAGRGYVESQGAKLDVPVLVTQTSTDQGTLVKAEINDFSKLLINGFDEVDLRTLKLEIDVRPSTTEYQNAQIDLSPIENTAEAWIDDAMVNTSNTVSVKLSGEDKTATKVWEHLDKMSAPHVSFQLMRHIAGTDPQPVPGLALAVITGETTTATWINLPNRDGNCHRWIYSVREVDSQGNPAVPENFESTQTDDLTITNSRIVHPAIDIEKYTLAEGIIDGDHDDVTDPYYLDTNDVSEGVHVGMVITNTGDIALQDLRLTDKTNPNTTGKVSNIQCTLNDQPVVFEDLKRFEVGEKIYCHGTLTDMVLGATHQDTASVAAISVVRDLEVTNSDPWNAVAPEPEPEPTPDPQPQPTPEPTPAPEPTPDPQPQPEKPQLAKTGMDANMGGLTILGLLGLGIGMTIKTQDIVAVRKK
ncbi:SpaA isopeptide-forming pilin-related protein [Arcanobacterium buesumense]|uniref:Cna B-type domain-containing protein n=1 Tax=Arcanobacterium buesumense TaxID=2722751 RepID=A0A6H2EL17_9ACTO|nr:SpaA isopeptide-forming pilin-related protein [Arcanobacterium buesumense]QJC21487.1 Cna B-type domain-containing protein [Arcanobacterium buesumense]